MYSSDDDIAGQKDKAPGNNLAAPYDQRLLNWLIAGMTLLIVLIFGVLCYMAYTAYPA